MRRLFSARAEEDTSLLVISCDLLEKVLKSNPQSHLDLHRESIQRYLYYKQSMRKAIYYEMVTFNSTWWEAGKQVYYNDLQLFERLRNFFGKIAEKVIINQQENNKEIDPTNENDSLKQAHIPKRFDTHRMKTEKPIVFSPSKRFSNSLNRASFQSNLKSPDQEYDTNMIFSKENEKEAPFDLDKAIMATPSHFLAVQKKQSEGDPVESQLSYVQNMMDSYDHVLQVVSSRIEEVHGIIERQRLERNKVACSECDKMCESIQNIIDKYQGVNNSKDKVHQDILSDLKGLIEDRKRRNDTKKEENNSPDAYGVEKVDEERFDFDEIELDFDPKYRNANLLPVRDKNDLINKKHRESHKEDQRIIGETNHRERISKSLRLTKKDRNHETNLDEKSKKIGKRANPVIKNIPQLSISTEKGNNTKGITPLSFRDKSELKDKTSQFFDPYSNELLGAPKSSAFKPNSPSMMNFGDNSENGSDNFKEYEMEQERLEIGRNNGELDSARKKESNLIKLQHVQPHTAHMIPELNPHSINRSSMIEEQK